MPTLRSNARVSPDDVRNIIDTGLATESLIEHINTASIRVDDIAAAADTTIAAERLRTIELYWAAEVACSQDPRAISDKISSASVKYDVRTTYGELAIDLDPTGTLSDAGASAGIWTPDAKGIR